MSTTNWEKVLGPAQSAMLRRLGERETRLGDSEFYIIGRDSLTAAALERRGLVSFNRGAAGIQARAHLTEFGRMVLRGVGTLSYRRRT